MTDPRRVAEMPSRAAPPSAVVRPVGRGTAEVTAVLRPVDAASASLGRRRRSWGNAISVAALACLMGVAGLTLGLLLADGYFGAGPSSNVRLATPEEIEAAQPAPAMTRPDADDPDSAAQPAAQQPPEELQQQPPDADERLGAQGGEQSDAQGGEQSGVQGVEQPAQAGSDEQPEFEALYPAPPVIEEPAVAVARAVGPSVVRIEVGTGLASGLGSGIVWDADNGYIVTNQHVVEGVDDVTVSFSDGTHLEGEVVGGSVAHDVAVVQVDPEEVNLVAAVLAPTDSVRVGQLAVAIGSPFGLTGTVTAGIVSAVRIQVQGGADPAFPVPVEMIQTDAAINRGNSGGALADWRGRVIGMNTLIQTTSGGSIGLGFAVPSDTVDLIASRVVKGESLELGYLGISSPAGDSDVIGVLIEEVVTGSAAERAGLRANDVILALDDEPMSDIGELSAAVKLRRPGEEVKLTVERGDEVLVFVVELGSPE